MIRAVIFDFDGLILETEVAVLQAWQETFRSHGAHLPRELWMHSIGSTHVFDPYLYLSDQTGKEVDRARVREEYRARLHELVADEQLLPGVSTYLEESTSLGLRVAVASSSPREWVAGHLENHDLLRYFDIVVCSDDVKRTKPDPELFLLSLERLGVNACEAIVLEDSLNGITAARSAGIFAVAVPGPLTRDADFSGADLRLASLEEMSLKELVELVIARRSA